MKKTKNTKLIAVVLSLIVIAALSATSFAEGPQGGMPQGNMQPGQPGGPQGGMQMNQQMGAPQGDFGQNQQMGAPQGDFGQNQQMGAPQGDFSQNNGQQPPEKPEGDDDRTPPANGNNDFGMNGQMQRGGPDPMNEILSAVNELEDEDVRANIESLMQAHRDAMDAERNAADDDARAEAAEAVTAAREALDAALSEAGIEVSMEMPEGQPPEKPEGSEPPADGQEPPEKPEGDESLTPPSDGRQLPEKPEGNAPGNSQQLSEDDENLFNLFRQFLNWLKGNTEE